MKEIIKLSAYKRKQLWKVFPSGLITLTFGLLYTLMERGILRNLDYYPIAGNEYDFYIQLLVAVPSSFLLGVAVSLLEILVFDQLFERQPFILKVFVKSVVYVIFVILFVLIASTISNAFTSRLSLFSEISFGRFWAFFTSSAILGILLFIGAIISVVLFVNEVFDFFGRRVSRAYIFGKYHTPKQEDRIFMFMDLKSSTTIAEELGHVQYFKWLNRYYRDITEYILRTDGDIYQYVGDEIIVTWEKEHGLEKERCLNCFYQIREGLELLRANYINEFGVFPQFKAGLHFGIVTTGEIGMAKKDIIYSGDVLNTTARIQESYKKYGHDFIVSDRIIAAFHGSDSYSFTSLGTIHLRGKIKSVGLFAVEPQSC